MSRFYPTVLLNHVTEIEKGLLRELGVKAMVIDIDNTLTTHNNPEVDDDVVLWIERMKDLGILMVLVSNNDVPRVAPFANKLGLPYVADAKKPLAVGYQRAQNILGVPVDQIAMVGDQLFTDVYGGNRFGMKTICVTPIQEENNLFFRLKRWGEQLILKKYHKQRRLKE